MKIAYIFPGQGAQKAGMGKDFYEASREAKAVFDLADQFIEGLKEVTFNGPQEKLTMTEFCQPAILTMSISALRTLEEHPKSKNIEPVFAAGLSLGEYSALAASRTLSFEDTLKLVERRGTYMEEAAKKSKGAMAAVIGLSKERVAEICQKTGAEVANFNSPEQIVITGEAAKVKEACQYLKEAGARKVIPLDVGGAFHSSLMRPAAEKFEKELEGVVMNPTEIKVISNVDGRPAKDADGIRANLAKQITSSVQWVESVKYMAGHGVKTFIEIGPGKVLNGLIRRIDPDLKVYNIERLEDIEELDI